MSFRLQRLDIFHQGPLCSSIRKSDNLNIPICACSLDSSLQAIFFLRNYHFNSVHRRINDQIVSFRSRLLRNRVVFLLCVRKLIVQKCQTATITPNIFLHSNSKFSVNSDLISCFRVSI